MEYKEFLIKLKGVRKSNEFKRYNDVLSEDLIYEIGYLIQSFRLKEISFLEMKNAIEVLNFSMDFVLEEKALKSYDFSTRKENNDYLPSDIRGLLLSNSEYRNVIVYYDTPMIKVLAKRRNSLAVGRLDEIKKFQYGEDMHLIRKRR